MTARAVAQWDWERLGIKIGISPQEGTVYLWDGLPRFHRTEADAPANEDAWLRLPEETARALYEALAELFGHNVVDMTNLRKDYEAERARVDKLLNWHIT